ncbi:Otu2 protein [Saccharomycopsis crataegensis]|uniref:Otu2 protein n=1 Tax=Saccharomycopsis crataegensis TaxID=43959 RepID=A0AAV5QK11_9ASCO|nr:Otu2 protein [Saccharomycopsis crataegensis]
MSELEESLLAKHRKELKDLQATVTGMKKQANKKNRKQVNKKCQELEDNLKSKHQQELKDLKKELGGEEDDEEENDDDEFSPEKLLQQLELEKKEEEGEIDAESVKKQKEEAAMAPGDQKKKKRNRQKERLAKRAAEQDKIREEAQSEAMNQVDYGAIEKQSLDQLCEKMKLVQYDILPDGNCLFASIGDQLKMRHGIEVEVKELRRRAADYIKKHESQFQPFLFDEETLTMGNLDEYVEKIKNTSEWGGDMEILALSKEFDVPISVLMSGRAAHHVNEDGSGSELKLVYYKHVYGLGEHYNSLRDA